MINVMLWDEDEVTIMVLEIVDIWIREGEIFPFKGLGENLIRGFIELKVHEHVEIIGVIIISIKCGLTQVGPFLNFTTVKFTCHKHLIISEPLSPCYVNTRK